MAGLSVFVKLLLVNLFLNEEFPGVTLPWPFSEEYLTTVARRSYELRMDPSDMIPFETSHVYQSVITRLPLCRELELQLGDIFFGDIDIYHESRYQRMISEWYRTLNLNSTQIMLSQDRPWMQSSDSTTLLPTPALQTTFESYPLTSHSNHVDASQVQSPCCEPVDGQSSQNIPEHATPSLGTIFEQNAESRSSTHNHHLLNGASGALNVSLHQYKFNTNETDIYKNNNTLESPDFPQPSLEESLNASLGLVSDPSNPTIRRSEDHNNQNTPTADNSQRNGINWESPSELPSGACTVPSSPTAGNSNVDYPSSESGSEDVSLNPNDRQSTPGALPQHNTARNANSKQCT